MTLLFLIDLLWTKEGDFFKKEDVIFKILSIKKRDGGDTLAIPIPMEKKIDFSSLAQGDRFPTIPTSTPVPSLQPDGPNLKKTFSTFYRREENKKIKRSLLKGLPFRQDVATAFKATDLDFEIEHPEKLPKDELNSIEKIFYSFEKRMILIYYYSLYTAYNKLLLSRPQLRKTLFDEDHDVKGKITFDHRGDIVTIKFLKGSTNDYVQELFEETLRGINSIPNPPQAFVEDDGKFTIYYHLKINSKGESP